MTNDTGLNKSSFSYGLILILIVSFFLLFRGTLKGLWDLWAMDGDYSYAFLLPFISAYICWEKRAQIARTPIDANWLGLVFLIVLLSISIYGILGSSPSAVRPAMPLILLALVFFCLGWPMFRVLVFPLGILIFMIPLSTTVQAAITSPLKLAASKVGVLIMRMFGIIVFLEGNVIDLGEIQLQMAEACSGLRYVLPLLVMGVLFAYFFEKIRWKQIMLVLATIPIAILVNGIRVGITGILAHHYGTNAIEGIAHDALGMLLYLIAFVLLFFCQICFKLIPMKPGPVSREEPQPSNETGLSIHRLKPLPVVISTILILLSAGLSLTTANLPKLALQDGFNRFPLTIAGWQGKYEPVDKEMVGLSGADEALKATYTNSAGRYISLYIGYRGTPFNENENFFHSPDICLPSSGWTIDSKQGRTITNLASMGTLTVKEMIVDKMAQKQVVYYWFQTKNRSSSNINMNRFHLSLHALMRDNTYDLFIRPITLLYPDENLVSAEQRMDGFVKDMWPVLNNYLKSNQTEK